MLTDVLPYETEASINVSARFGAHTLARHGNFLTPDKTIEPPQICFTPADPEMHYSLAFFDADYPSPEKGSLVHSLLWARFNIRGDGPVVVKPDASYVAPHPARGSGSHRLILVLIEHQHPFDRTVGGEFDCKQLLGEMGGSVRGYVFFRSCWTKAVSAIYRDALNRPEPLFGLVKEPIPIRPYRYTNA